MEQYKEHGAEGILKKEHEARKKSWSKKKGKIKKEQGGQKNEKSKEKGEKGARGKKFKGAGIKRGNHERSEELGLHPPPPTEAL